ncbi:MAG: uroporphyrinogen decarboxylase family protein [Anaerolineae bacterium]|jgi:uroporphyrinogen decarboxylase
MNSRERVLAALSGQEPDRVPVTTGFRKVELAELAAPERGGGGHAEAERYRVDVRFVSFKPSPAQAEFEEYVRAFPRDTRIGRETLVRGYYEWGYRPDVVEVNPLAWAQSEADLDRYPWPDLSAPYRSEGLEAEVEALHAQDYAVAGNLPHLGGELFETAWRLRGFAAFNLDLLDRPALANALLDRLAQLAGDNARRLAEIGVDVLVLDDDVGMPGGMIISPELWRRYLAPRLRRVIEGARAVKPDLRVLYHSDGVITPILHDLADLGVDAINPVQPDRMDPLAVRRALGTRLALWGTVGTQAFWPYARPEEVAAEVRTRLKTLGPRGLVLAPAYDVDEPDVPWSNLRAFLEAAGAFN